ncbi:MAG: NAD(P)/FAD-dependent oxidoreductase [Geminicoccaceae bacterium]|nr:NAD(P)/FAD-dependent oxidoreductase [Geminicoccaceae bacterium]
MKGAPIVVVVGAGPAGVAAARRLAEAGLRPIVLDSGPEPGGRIWRNTGSGAQGLPRLPGHDPERGRHERARFVEWRERIAFYPETTVIDVTRGRLWALASSGEVDSTPWDRLIVATGALDRVVPVPGWTLPGVVTLGGAQTALKTRGCAVGRRIAFFGTGPLLYLAAAQHLAAGVEVAVVGDTSRLRDAVAAAPDLLADPARLRLGLRCLRMLRRAGVPVLRGVRGARIEGRKTVEAIVLERRRAFWRFSCDAVATGFGLVPQTQILDLLDVPFTLEETSGLWLPLLDRAGRTSIPGVYAAGDGARPLGAEAAAMAGERAALALLEDEGSRIDAGRVAQLETTLARHERFARALARAFPHPRVLEAEIADETVVCRCENVTAGDLRRAVRELDARDVSEAKAFTRCGMGRCQGRLCGLSAARILAAIRNVRLAEAGRLRSQAPVLPMPVAARRVPAEDAA